MYKVVCEIRCYYEMFASYILICNYILLFRTSTIPALFIFEKASISPSNCVRNLLDHGLKSGKPVLVH